MNYPHELRCIEYTFNQANGWWDGGIGLPIYDRTKNGKFVIDAIYYPAEGGGVPENMLQLSTLDGNVTIGAVGFKVPYASVFEVGPCRPQEPDITRVLLKTFRGVLVTAGRLQLVCQYVR